jgi:hypothetical protein
MEESRRARLDQVRAGGIALDRGEKGKPPQIEFPGGAGPSFIALRCDAQGRFYAAIRRRL